MKNIIKIFVADAKRISTNVVALVIIMGLSIIPALYAWFNIMSNWDPYGTAATSQMKIGVYSLDTGFTIGDMNVSIGDKIIESLEANTVIDWQFPDSEEETLENVYSGDYYAALIIPENFTTDMLSFIGGDPDNPTIDYYENSKKNAIATKITSKVKTTVQQSVNTSIMSSITEVVSETGEVLTGDSVDGSNVLSSLTENIEQTSSDLETYEDLLTSMALLTDSANGLVGTTGELLPCIELLLDSGNDSLDSMDRSIENGAQTAETMQEMVNLTLTSLQEETTRLQSQVDSLTVGMDTDEIINALNSCTEMADASLAILSRYTANNNSDYNSAFNNLSSSYTQLVKDIEKFNTDATSSAKKLKQLKTEISGELTSINSAVNDILQAFDSSVAPTLNTSVSEMQQSIMEAKRMLGNVDQCFPEIKEGLSDYSQVLSSTHDDIVTARDYISDLRTDLTAVSNALKALSGNQEYEDIVNMLQTDPSAIATFVSSPLTVNTEKIYEIETYGSAMAPFYTVLALWVGGLIMTALLHVKVKDSPEIKGAKDWQKFFGRYQVFFLTAEAQTLIVVLGNLYFVKIQCLHPFRFWLAAAVMSFMFSFFMYALTAAWGNIGQALAVIVMVIQVAGAGGTFPIEVLPKAYQMVYKFLPFVYGMNALRECVGGMYQNDYWKDLAVLGLYILLSVPIGLFLGKPFKKLNAALEESKKKSGVMM